jgi:hypothetical protein
MLMPKVPWSRCHFVCMLHLLVALEGEAESRSLFQDEGVDLWSAPADMTL